MCMQFSHRQCSVCRFNRGPTGGEAKGGVKRKLTRLPIDVGVVAGEPRKTQDQREVGQRDQLEGNILRVAAMNAYGGRIEVDDGGGKTAVDELNWDGAWRGTRAEEEGLGKIE